MWCRSWFLQQIISVCQLYLECLPATLLFPTRAGFTSPEYLDKTQKLKLAPTALKLMTWKAVFYLLFFFRYFQYQLMFYLRKIHWFAGNCINFFFYICFDGIIRVGVAFSHPSFWHSASALAGKRRDIAFMMARYHHQEQYCTISNCSAWPVTRDRCAEILLRQTPVWPVTLPNFGELKFRPGMLRLRFHRFHLVTAGQGQSDPWQHMNFGAVRGVRDPWLLNNSKWYSISSKFQGVANE